jgi:hypothetical protein
MKTLLNRIWMAIAKPLKQSFQRFPEALMVSFILGTLMVFNNELGVFINNQAVADMALIEMTLIFNDLNQSLFIVLPLMISLSLMIERFQFLKTYRLALIITMVVMGGLYFTFLRLENSLVVEFNRFSNLVFAFYGLVIFLPYLMDRQDIGVGIILFFTKLFTSLFYSFRFIHWDFHHHPHHQHSFWTLNQFDCLCKHSHFDRFLYFLANLTRQLS